MDYEQKYKDLVKAVKELQEVNPSDERIQHWVNDNVSELIDSEDEKIRKEIIKFIKVSKPGWENYSDYSSWIVWLENQGEQTIAKAEKKNFALSLIKYLDNNRIKGCMDLSSIECEDLENAVVNSDWQKVYNYMKKKLEKQGEQKEIDYNEELEKCKANPLYFFDKYVKVKFKEQNPTDKVEPKFKVGDWIISPGGCYLHILDIKKDGYLCEDVLGEKIKVLCEHSNCDFKSWTIQDAKDGDVLALEWKDECQWQKIVIFKSLNEFGVEGYGNTFKNNKLAFKADIPCYSKTWTKYLHPATKEQRDLLFQMMKEAGYKWDSVKKELKRIDNEWVNLGLPSGTLWKSTNEEGYYTHDKAVENFGGQLPTKEQLEELKEKCTWVWQDNGYIVIGPNRKSIFMPAVGYCNSYGNVFNAGSYGYYWLYTSFDSTHAWYLYFNSSGVSVDNTSCRFEQSVRLVKK